MLAPDDRHVLLDLLSPPPGFRLDSAIGTTFTLGLEAALVIPLAFASARLSAGRGDPIALMQAVRQVSDQVDLFCQAGQMSVPRKATTLFGFLEGMVHEVRRPRPGHLFHPKVWFLRFVCEGETPQLRLLCLTRNLTEGAAWDAALRLEGDEGKRDAAANRPLAEFIASLPGRAVRPLDQQRIDRIAALAAASRRAEWYLPEGFTAGPTFWPFPLSARQTSPDFSGYRHLVMAPFLNEAGIGNLVPPDARTRLTVVSRVEELERLSPDQAAALGDARIVSAAADLEDPDATSVHGLEPGLSGLHAKLYVVERNKAAHVFIGSANATDAAFGGNVEFLVELVGGATKVGVDRFLHDPDGMGSLLETYTPVGGAEPDPKEELLQQLRDVLRDAAELPFKATVIQRDEEFEEVISAPALTLPAGFSAWIELATRPGHSATLEGGKEVDAVLGPVPLEEVTPFIVLSIRANTSVGELTQASVIRCELVNDPPGRLDEVLARQVDTPEKFLRFLLLLLGFTSPQAWLEGGEGAGEGAGGVFGVSTTGVFELLARACADQPEALDDVASLVKNLLATSAGHQVLPPGFDDLWKVIEAARPGLESLRQGDDAHA